MSRLVRHKAGAARGAFEAVQHTDGELRIDTYENAQGLMDSNHPRLRLQLACFTFTRLIVSTAIRMVYPFLPAIARGTGVALEHVALAVAIRSGLGLAGPLLGSIADTRGRRWAMVFGLLVFAAGLSVIAVWPSYLGLVVGFILSGAGSIVADSAIYAYLGDEVAYEHRATAIGITEIGWSSAYLIGVPVVGWVIGRSGWSAPFVWLALLGALAAILLRSVVTGSSPDRRASHSFATGVRLILSHRAAMAGLLVSLLLVTGNQLITIVYGVWMEEAHGLRVTELGAASSVLGLAGLAGVGLVALAADRLGKRRAVALGIGFNILACAVLPLTEQSLAGTLACLFLFYLSFEFSLVSAITILNELVPAARGTLMAANVAALAIGDAVGAFLGPLLFASGLLANVSAVVALDLTGLVLLCLFVRVRVAVRPGGKDALV